MKEYYYQTSDIALGEDGKHLLMANQTSHGNMFATTPEIKPIKITHEILAHLGFLRHITYITEYKNVIQDKTIFINTYFFNANLYSVSVFVKQKHLGFVQRLQYIHELQQALRALKCHDFADSFKDLLKDLKNFEYD